MSDEKQLNVYVKKLVGAVKLEDDYLGRRGLPLFDEWKPLFYVTTY